MRRGMQGHDVFKALSHNFVTTSVTTSLTRDAVPMLRIVSTFLFIHVDSEKSMKVDT